MKPSMRIDAHQHFWDLSRGDYGWLTPQLGGIYRNFLPADLQPLLKTAGIDGTILVQAADTEAETEFMLSLADKTDWIMGVVGWVDMAAKATPDSIARFARNPKFRGIRPMLQGMDDDHWILRPELAPAVRALVENGLAFDALVTPRHLASLLEFLQRHPDLRVVLDHCAKPAIRDGSFQPWADQISEIAEKTSAFCKVSGLFSEKSSDQNPQEIIKYARHVLACFGPERVMFGSDWPVLTLAGSYDDWTDIATEICADLNPEQQEQVFGGTAARFYLG